MDLNHPDFSESLRSLKYCGSDLRGVFHVGFVPSPACSKAHLQAIADSSDLGKGEEDKGQLQACVCLKTLPALLSI